MAKLKKAYRILTRFEELVCSVTFIALVFMIVYDIIRRKITGNSLPWLGELSASSGAQPAPRLPLLPTFS